MESNLGYKGRLPLVSMLKRLWINPFSLLLRDTEGIDTHTRGFYAYEESMELGFVHRFQ